MGHKKRNVAPSRSSKASGAPPPSPVVSNGGGGGGSVSDGVVSSVETEQNNTNSNSSIEIQQQQQQQSKIEASVVESDASPYTGVKLECERALKALCRGSHAKALRLMKEMCLKHENSAHSALIHRVQGTVCVRVASIIDEPNAKQRHLKNAIESARKAAVSSPNSIEFAHFYAKLLYEAANDGKEYEEVVQECERALAIENPVDPKESLQDESQQKILTADARISHVQNELRSLISISTWKKNLGNEEEKFGLIPIRRVLEDPTEVRLVQARRPNEIKKATKTPDERRKEIEVRVAAARLLQQKSEAPQSQNDEKKALDSSSGSVQRAAERRKSGNLRKNASSAERRDWVRSYWNSMSLDMKKDLIRIRTRMREEKSHQGMEILQMLEKDFYHLQSMYERKCELFLSYEEALQSVEDLCLEEGKKREHVTEFIRRSYESVLRKRREELIESDNDIMFISNRFELDAISHVLKEAESLNANQLGFEETYSGVTNQLCDLESGEDDDWRMKDYLHQVDSCIEVAIQRQKEQLATELSKLDAKMMRNLTGMQQMEAKLDPVSALDYRLILVPLVKSFMRARLEDLAEKDATEKSDAAREAFLAELALDSKKGTGGGSDNSRNVQEKTRDKKKNKENRKTKDLKATGTDELVLHHETTEQGSFPVASDVDYPDSEIVLSISGDALKQQEEEIRRRIELEAEERKLEETLEYQRRIEEEAKQKHLAEQNKKTTTTIPDKHSDDDQDRHEQLKPCKKEPLTQQNGFPNVLEGALVNAADRSAQRIGNTHGHLHTYVKQGLPNGGISEDGALSSDRRTGRKGRRQRSSSKLVDAKYQAVSSEKENIEAGQVTKDGPHGDSNNPCVGDNGTKTLRQLRAEEDDEERFQADIKKAVRQSLDTFQAHKKVPLISGSRMSQKISSDVDNLDVALNEVTLENVNGADVYGTGLKNEVGEYNCFLNVIIQSLWHLRQFRDEFMGRSTSEHHHVGDPCVTCALYDIFTALSVASTDMRREAVAPTSLRIALSNMYPDDNFFQEAQMNDASEVLGVIFDCLHSSFTSGLSVSDTESVESNCKGSWDCTNTACIAHSLFGMDIFERMNCYNCGLESRHMKYTSFFHNINASALRTMKVMCAENSFDELLHLVEMNHQLACDTEAGGCGKHNHIHHILSTPPHVFTTVMGWQNTCESAEDIASTLAALDTEIDIGVLYRGLDPKNKHSLVSVVCYYGQHYYCFAYSHDHERWVMYDDKTVKVIGGWDNVLTKCEKGKLQPQVLFFEAVN